MDDDDEFYEDDESVEKIRAAFDRGVKVFTKRPSQVTFEKLRMGTVANYHRMGSSADNR